MLYNAFFEPVCKIVRRGQSEPGSSYTGLTREADVRSIITEGAAWMPSLEAGHDGGSGNIFRDVGQPNPEAPKR